MTVQTAETKTHYAGNGLTTEWPVPFPVVQDEHIKLIKVGPLGESEDITTGYAVNGVDSGDVSVTYPTTGEPLAAGWQLTIYRKMPLTQTLDLERGGAFDAEVIERQGFDHMVMQIQQVQEQVARALQLAITDVDRTPDDVLGEMFELRGAAQQALSLAQQALQAAQDASQTANGASQATQGALSQVEQSLQETAQTVQGAQQSLQEMEVLMQEIEGLAESMEELGNLGEVLQEVQTALTEVQDALAALNSLGPGTATVSGFTPLAPEGWEEGWALALAADGSTTYSAPPEIPEVPLAAAPSGEHPDGVAGLVVPDGETIGIALGRLFAFNQTHIGDIRFWPFRASELPTGWYFCNGDHFLLSSPQGQVLNALSADYKADWGITITGEYITIPSLFSADGRGLFLRAVSGGGWNPGNIQNDAMRNFTGTITFTGSQQAVPSPGGTGVFTPGASSAASRPASGTSLSLPRDLSFDPSSLVPTAAENRPVNVGMTPAIYLGV